MGRVYRLSKIEPQEKLDEIAREMKQLDDVTQVAFTGDRQYMEVVTKDDKFETVMNQAVNICRRIGQGLEISFSKFVY